MKYESFNKLSHLYTTVLGYPILTISFLGVPEFNSSNISSLCLMLSFLFFCFFISNAYAFVHHSSPQLKLMGFLMRLFKIFRYLQILFHLVLYQTIPQLFQIHTSSMVQSLIVQFAP